MAKIFNSMNRNKLAQIGGILIFAGLMTWLLAAARAATPYVSMESEQATLAGTASKVTDTQASGSSYVNFAPATPPVSGVSISPGQSIQAVVDANPAGTTFIIKAGTHTKQQVTLKAPAHSRDTFIGEEGAILDGGGTTEYAFGGVKGGNGAQYITLKNLIVQNYAPASQSAAIRPFGLAYYWTIDDCEVHHNANWGIQVDSGWVVRNSHIHHNGTLGIGGGGSNTIIEDNEIAWNNTTHADSHWEAGGTKFVYSDNLVVRRNDVHDNEGPGIWFDGNSTNSIYEYNEVYNNYGPGIDHEINGSAIIRYNTVRNNGFGWTGWVDGAGILVANSSDVEVYGNTVEYNNDGIGAIQSDRGSFPDLKNLWVHDNVIKMNSGQTGIASNTSDPIFSSAWNNRFDNNTYTLGSGSTYYYNGSSGAVTKAVWQTLGQDLHSTWTN